MTKLSREDAAARGMTLAFHAASAPDRMALRSPNGDRTFGELNARCNQLVRALRARGLRKGDSVALLCANRPEFAEVLYAGARAGLRVTPINWHLTGEEIGYVVDNCEAKAFVADARFEQTAEEAARHAPGCRLSLAIGGTIAGFDDYEAVLAPEKPEDLEDPVLGGTMLYTSGTTGRPKGVYRRKAARSRLAGPLTKTAAVDPDVDVALCTGPLYHAAPLALNLSFPLTLGMGVVLMDQWSEEETLRLIDEHRVTHTHMVPTMFHRLLRLPEQVRKRYDVSSLRWVLHGAAPCPVQVKREMIEWLGPVIYEYYAATEGGGTYITPEEWLEKPGSVGKPADGESMVVLDDENAELPADEVGTIFFKAPEVPARFEYFKAPEKTASAYRGDLFTLGDMGYRDGDGYYFLTGRSADVIISGGVNIYPAQVDEVLLGHPAVSDVATVGIPSEEWGEEVRAVVLLADGRAPDEGLAGELLEHCRAKLAHYMCPRSVDFTNELPRMPTGKIQRRLVRDRYWQGSEKKI